MKFSENWLRTLVNPVCDRATLVQRLTMAGLEVESIELLGDHLDHVLIAEIVAVEKHPNADKLRVCQVSMGSSELHQIVCGAANARVGLKAPLATIGAKLPNGIEIKKAKLREVESFGMLCSAKELLLSEFSEGLLELPEDAPVGQALAAYLEFPDASIEIKLTPNRPDCLGLNGLAAEIRALFDFAAKPLEVAAVPVTSQRSLAIKLENPEDCPRYLGRVIEGIDATIKTPLWMQERLHRSGMRSVNVAVDCSNYVMIELGQPTHTFDLEQIKEGIFVRRAHADEKLKLLDGREVTLNDEFLAIADSSKVLAVAGVMGGFETRVTDMTQSLFLESAFFTPAAIQGRARKLGLHTDASHRFERGVDPQLPRRALERLTGLIIEIAGGRAGPVTEAVETNFLPARAPVMLRRERLARVLGMSIPDAKACKILQMLEMDVEPTASGWLVTPPSKRFDIEIEEDLIEEVARIYGYDQVPVARPCGEITLGLESESAVKIADIRQALLARGYMEALHFSFVPADLLKLWGMDQDLVKLSNPLSLDMEAMRTSLLPGLVNTLQRNQARQQERIRLFEIGKTFFAGDAPLEQIKLAGVAIGAAHDEQWGEAKRAVDFFDLKGDLAQVLALTGEPSAFKFEPASEAWLHAGRSADIHYQSQKSGMLGCLDPKLTRALGVEADVYVFEVDLATISQRLLPKATDISRFPLVRRDLALIVDQSVPYARIQRSVQAALGKILSECFLFDEFSGPGLPKNTRSLAIGLILQDTSRTLTDIEVDAVIAATLAALEADTGAKLRS